MKLEAHPNEVVNVREVDRSTGLGMFACAAVQSGSVIYTDSPLVSIQHTANRRFIKACQNCHRPLGGVADQLAQIFAEERFAHVDLSAIKVPSSPAIFNCNCGEMYCSLECATDANKKHHRYLCVAGTHGDAIAEFKYHCLSVEGCGDNLLLLAQLLAVLESQSNGDISLFESSLKQLMTYTNRPFDEVARPPEGSDRDHEWKAWLSETITLSFELLMSALIPQSPVFARFFSNKMHAFDVCSRILAIFELNNIDIAIPTGLGFHLKTILMSTSEAKSREQLIRILREKEVVMRALWSNEARGVYEDDDDEDDEAEVMSEENVEDEEISDDCCSHVMDEEGAIEEMLEEIRQQVAEMSVDELLESECPDFHGTGFYLSVARTNHSCDPNVTMEFENFNCIVSCKTLRNVNANDELRMSYISRPDTKSVQVRRRQLQDYLFECSCDLCEKQWSARKFNAM